MTRLHRILIVFLPIFIAIVIVFEWLRTDKFHWSYIGVAILVVVVIWLHSKRGIQKLIGEYPNPQRNRAITQWGGFLIPFLVLILSLYMILFEMNRVTIDYKNFLVLIVSPILLAICFGIMRIPDLTIVTKTRLKSIIKKLATSTILFFLFIPLFGLTNVLKPNIDSAPDLLNGFSWFKGFIVWSMVSCFFVGLYLFCYAVLDFIPAIKDVSTRKRSKPKSNRQRIKRESQSSKT